MAIFKENQTGLLQPHFETHRGMMVMLGMISGPFQEISFDVITWNSESNCTCREKNHFLIHKKRDQNCRYFFGRNAGENIDDCWNVDGDRDLSETWTGFSRFIVMNEKPPDGKAWSRRRLTGKQTTSRPDTLWPETWKDMSYASKRKEKRKWAFEKP